MNITGIFENEKGLTIYLQGAMDSVTAPEAEEKIMGLRKEYPEGKVILDAEQLHYVSSSGLRVFLKLCKQEKNVKMIHTSRDVYDVMEMTGFVDLMEVHRALRNVDVEGCEVLGVGGHGKVVRLNADTIVKLYHPGVTQEEVEREQEYAKKAFVKGIPTAIPFDVVKCGEQYGLVFELVDSDTLSNHLNKHPEQMEEYAVKYAAMLKELHSIQVSEGEMDSTRVLYRERLEAMRQFMTKEEVDMLQKINDAIPDGNTVVHGDFHPRNVMLQGTELVLIDMADLTVGHPLYDLGSMGVTHHVTRDARIENITNMKASEVRKLWRLFLENYLETTDENVIGLAMKKASVVAMMKIASTVAFSPEAKRPEVIETLLAMVRKNLLENAEDLMKLLSM